MSTQRIAWLVAALAAVGGCSLESITFLDGDPDASTDGVADSPIDMPSGPLGIEVSNGTLSVAEGQTKTLGVSLTRAPAGAVLVTLASSDDTRIGLTQTAVLFSTTDWNVVQNVTVTGRQDADTANETGTITLSSTTVQTPVIVGTTVVDDDGLSLMLSSSSLDVGEGSTGNVSVHLSAQPATNVVVAVVSSNTAVATTSQTMLTFTPANYAIDQTITITGMQDANTVDNAASIDFSSGALTATSLAIQVTDDDVLNITPSISSVGVAEGSTQTFTVQLNLAPPGQTTVSVSAGNTAIATVTPSTLTFNAANYNVPQTITVAAVNDDDVADNATTVTLAAMGLTSRAVAVDVTDDDTQAIMTTPATTLTVAEGGTSQLAVSLAFRPSTPVTLSVNSLDPTSATVTSNTVTFSSSNYSVPQMVGVNGVQDADAVPDITTIRADSALLGLIKDVTVNVSEDDTLAIEASAATVAVTEGGTTTFMVRLTAQPVATTIAIASGDPGAASITPSSLAFTAANWSSFQTVTVTGVQDPDLAAETTTLQLSSAGLASVGVAVNVTDDDMQAIVADRTTVAVTEGQSTSVGVTLAFVPTSSVTVAVTSMNPAAATVLPATLTFTPANFNVPQNIAISGSQDSDAVAATTMVSLTATGGIPATPAAIMVNVTDDDALNIDITPRTLAIAEGGTSTLQIRLTAMPASPTTVTITSGDTGAVTVSTGTLTFDPTNYATYQNVTVNGIEDLDAAPESVTITASSGGLTPQTATVGVTDNDTLSIATNVAGVSLVENGTATFNVHLTAQPTTGTTVTLTSSDTGAATVLPATLTFTTANYAIDQAVTLTGVADIDVSDETVAITLAAANIPTATVTATVVDDDMQAIQVSAASVTVGEGASTSVNVTLALQPTGSVVVDVASLAPGVAGVSPSSLTFNSANYTTPQAISISGNEDPDAASGTTTIMLTLANATSASVGVSVTDNDTLGIEIAPVSLTIGEAGSGSFQIRLTAQPQMQTTVNVVSSDIGAATVSVGALTFTAANWNVFQLVTIAGVADADSANENVTITVTSANLTTRTVSVAVTDDDVPGIAASPTNLSLGEAGAGTFNVHLTAPPASPLTVTITNPDSGAVSVSTTSLTFTSANYATNQAVTVTGVADIDDGDESVQLTLSSPGLAPVTVTANVDDDDVQAFVISSTALTISEGQSSAFTVALAFQPVQNVPVSISSSNNSVAGVTVTTLIFTPANYSVPQTVGVNAVVDADVNFNSATLTIGAFFAQRTVAITVREPGIIDAIVNTQPSFCVNGETSIRVRLAGNPLTPLTLTLTISPTSRASATPTSVVFDATSFSTYETIVITGNSINSLGLATLTVKGAGLTDRTTTFSVLSTNASGCSP